MGGPFTGGICMGAAEGGLGRDGVWRPAEVPSGAQLPGAESAVWRPAILFSPAGPTDYCAVVRNKIVALRIGDE